MASLSFPHIIRIFSRTLVLLLILAFGGVVIFAGELGDHTQAVLGLKTGGGEVQLDDSEMNIVDVNEEINRMLGILEKRPDYASAWLRLSVLYEQIGERDFAEQARETARKLNPDF